MVTAFPLADPSISGQLPGTCGLVGNSEAFRKKTPPSHETRWSRRLTKNTPTLRVVTTPRTKTTLKPSVAIRDHESETSIFLGKSGAPVELSLIATSPVGRTISHYRLVEKPGGRGHGYRLFQPFWHSESFAKHGFGA